MLESTQGSLTMVGLNTDAPQVFWNGERVEVLSVRVDEDHKVMIRIKEDPIIAGMMASGIVIKREV